MQYFLNISEQRSELVLPIHSLGIISLHARGGFWAAATSKMERFVIIVNGFQALTIITKRSILHVGASLDPPLHATVERGTIQKSLKILNYWGVAIC